MPSRRSRRGGRMLAVSFAVVEQQLGGGRRGARRRRPGSGRAAPGRASRGGRGGRGANLVDLVEHEDRVPCCPRGGAGGGPSALGGLPGAVVGAQVGLVAEAPQASLTKARRRALAVLCAGEVFPTPGGPARHRTAGLAGLRRRTARCSRRHAEPSRPTCPPSSAARTRGKSIGSPLRRSTAAPAATRSTGRRCRSRVGARGRSPSGRPGGSASTEPSPQGLPDGGRRDDLRPPIAWRLAPGDRGGRWWPACGRGRRRPRRWCGRG